MKEPKTLYMAVVTTPGVPDEGYIKLYPKSDGFYSLDPDGNEVKLEGVIVLNRHGEELDQKRKIKFDRPFRTTVEGDEIVVSFEGDEGDVDADDDFTFMHNNDFHEENYATENALNLHKLNTDSVHGLNIANVNASLHTQGTDQKLDEGGDNEVSAAEIRNMLSTSTQRAMLKTSDAETNVTGSYTTYIANTENGNVSFVLPEASGFSGEIINFRKAHANNAMTIYRSGDDNIMFDDSAETLLTFGAKGDWVRIQSDGSNWHVIAG